MQVLGVNLYHNTALLHALFGVGYFVVLLRRLFVVLSNEDEAFPVAKRSDEHHVHDILIVELLMMNNFLKTLLVDITRLFLVPVEIDKVVDQVGA